MISTRRPLEESVNFARFAGTGGGFYESYFLRANHPERPLAFWIRYTLFSPRRDPGGTVGELWAIVFDGERSRHHALKAEIPWSDCRFDSAGFDVRVGAATLGSGKASGSIGADAGGMSWDLRFTGAEPPLFLMPRRSYEARFPPAKALVALPSARFEGVIETGGERISVDGWTGSQNHNWGPRHTDRYAWGQVAGFDTHRDSFLEVATGWQKIGALWSPSLTFVVLRHGGREYALNGLAQALKARARLRYFDWEFSSAGHGITIDGRISARREDFVGLAYRNPPGGTRTCLNSKIAACRLTLHEGGGNSETLETQNRAAFEMLTDDTAHGVPIAA